MKFRHGLPFLGEFLVRLSMSLHVPVPDLRTVATRWIQNFQTAAGCTPKLGSINDSTAHMNKGFAYVTAAPGFC